MTCALHRDGYDVFLPVFSAHSRIDLIAVRDRAVVRVQCKTSRLRNGALVFRTCSNTANVPRRYDGEIDVFGVYSPELGTVYLVPPDAVPSGEWCSLRVDRPVSNQRIGIRYAADYELTRRR